MVTLTIANVSFSGIQTGSNLCLKCGRTLLAPGSAQTRWGSLSAPPDLVAAIRGHTSKGKWRRMERKDEDPTFGIRFTPLIETNINTAEVV